VANLKRYKQIVFLLLALMFYAEKEGEEEGSGDELYYAQRGILTMKRYIIEILFYFPCTWK